ncbi:MAG: cobalt-precorrin-6A reductase [Sulfitobacter sp.]
MQRVLLLGGTTEASTLAKTLHSAAIETIFSYAGRTRAPIAQPVPTRIGGFGGVAGLTAFLRAEHITHMVDATHPFAAGMSANAAAAAAQTGVPLLRFERPAWQAGPGDNWAFCPDIGSALAHLPAAPATVFLAIGKQHIGVFAARPEHHYLLRLVDTPEAPLPLPKVSTVIARGPFTLQGDLDLMRNHGVTHIIAKNAGGTGARAKLDAARQLHLPVIMIDRPALPKTAIAPDIETVLHWLAHEAERGV